MKFALIQLCKDYIVNGTGHKFSIVWVEDSTIVDVFACTNPKHALDYVNEKKIKSVFVEDSDKKQERVFKTKLIETLNSLK